MNDWHALGDVFYHLHHLYPAGTMAWGNINLEDYLISGAQNGGPIAMIRKDARGGEMLIYTASGNLLTSIKLTEYQIVHSCGWTGLEHLMILFESGTLQSYQLNGEVFRKVILVNEITDAPISEAHFWADGCVALTSDMRLWAVEGVGKSDLTEVPRTFQLSTNLTRERSVSVTSIGVIAPSLTRSGLLEVLVGTSERSILVVDESGAEDQLMQDRLEAPVTKMAVAPNGRFVACFQKDGVTTVMSTSFTQKILDFDTNSVTRPSSLSWCGEDCMVLHWKNMGILLVGPYGDWLNFPYDGKVAVVNEFDCCRVLKGSSCDLLQRVPAVTEAIHRIGSTDPAALLYDAAEAFENGDTRADENVRSMGRAGVLSEAINSCIEAAAADWDPAKQQAYLRAASYGKVFYDAPPPSHASTDSPEGYSAEVVGDGDLDQNASFENAQATTTAFVRTSQRLRVLNHLRRPEIGLPLTLGQLERSGLPMLLARLAERSQHHVALRVGRLLRVDCGPVATDWACEKLRRMVGAAATDATVHRVLMTQESRLQREGYRPGAQPCRFFGLDLAATAYRVGRRRLAEMLLRSDEQVPAGDQIPLLLSVGENALALKKAVASSDADLIYLTVIHLAQVEAQAMDKQTEDGVVSRRRRGSVRSSVTGRQLARAAGRVLAGAGSASEPVEEEKGSVRGSSLPGNESNGAAVGEQDSPLAVLLTDTTALNFLRLYFETRVSSTGRGLLHGLYARVNQPVGMALAALQQACEQRGVAQRIHIIHEATELLGTGLAKGTISGKTGPVSAANAEALKATLVDEVELLETQRRLETESLRSFVGYSLAQTIYKLLQLSFSEALEGARWEREVVALTKQFKMSDKQLWCLRIQCYGHNNQWALLSKLAERKSPVGYKPFCLVAIRYGQPASEISRYLERLSNQEDRLALALDRRIWSQAVEAATKLRDYDTLKRIAEQCGDPELERQIGESLP